ncbi:MAG: hypothetical protein L0G09_08125, partial [Acinetobacter sp.]|nr:hypothetical protein [Acinetobacter sp.]
IFSQLTPKQSTKVSKIIAKTTGLGENVILDQVLSHIGEQDVFQGIQLNQLLHKIFEYDHLDRWAINRSNQEQQLEQQSEQQGVNK